MTMSTGCLLSSAWTRFSSVQCILKVPKHMGASGSIMCSDGFWSQTQMMRVPSQTGAEQQHGGARPSEQHMLFPPFLLGSGSCHHA